VTCSFKHHAFLKVPIFTTIKKVKCYTKFIKFRATIINNSKINFSLTSVSTEFNKYEGTGNDFIIIDNRDLSFIAEKDIISVMCHRRFGIGADGLILIEPGNEADFRMRYFNADGGEGSMCGNGGRCAAHFAFRNGIAGHEMDFTAFDGVHHAIVEEETVTITLADVKHIEVDGNTCFLNTGSPHYVEFFKDPDSIDVILRGREIRYSPRFAPEGTNVNFVKVTDTGIFVRTYERGVENETLSCGTGVTASAIAAVITGHFDSPPVVIDTLGGRLTVNFKAHDGEASGVILTGPATFVYSGFMNPK
jgi:diaminopimelate epimerase